MMGRMLLAASIYWHLPILVVLVSLVYSATRFDEWDRIAHYAIRSSIYIVVFMGTVFFILFSLSTILPLFLG
jgi:hypothetical protein